MDPEDVAHRNYPVFRVEIESVSNLTALEVFKEKRRYFIASILLRKKSNGPSSYFKAAAEETLKPDTFLIARSCVYLFLCLLFPYTWQRLWRGLSPGVAGDRGGGMAYNPPSPNTGALK
jgi:hypothetical protein